MEKLEMYRVIPNQFASNELNQSVIQLYHGETPGDVLGAGRTEKCQRLAAQLNRGELMPAEVEQTLRAELSRWHCYIIPDIMTWNSAAGPNRPSRTPIEMYDTYEEALVRFQELRDQKYNDEVVVNPQTGEPFPRLTFGIQREQPPSAADLLHVRGGQNYLVDDFTRMSPDDREDVVQVLRRMQEDIGFARVRLWLKDDQGKYPGKPVDKPLDEWKNPYFVNHKDRQRQAVQEGYFLTYPGDAFAIYQISDVANYDTRLRFLALSSVKELGHQVDRKNYNLVYVGEFSPTDSNDVELEKLYERFNVNHPTDFRGHSLSVSDIVALKRDGVVSYHYCDSIGFKEVPEFMQKQGKSRSEHTEKCVESKKRTERER